MKRYHRYVITWILSESNEESKAIFAGKNFLGKEILEFCPIESVKAIFGKICQILANLDSLKCDPYVKHLFLR